MSFKCRWSQDEILDWVDTLPEREEQVAYTFVRFLCAIGYSQLESANIVREEYERALAQFAATSATIQ